MFKTHSGQGAFDVKEATSQKAPVILPLTPDREKLLFSKIDIEGTKAWNDDLKHQTTELFKEYAHIFALDSLDMGHTSLVKHKIKLDNYTPFKERYRCIPPNLFEEVKNHLKEMIQVGAIRRSSSPWASAVVLVRKKDGSLAKADIKLKPSKCEFFRSKITYLDHIVSAVGIETDPRKIKAVKDLTVPKTVTDIRSFLGFTNHYRRFIWGYTKVAQPLNTLISGDDAN